MAAIERAASRWHSTSGWLTMRVAAGPLISKGLLGKATQRAGENVAKTLYQARIGQEVYLSANQVVFLRCEKMLLTPPRRGAAKGASRSHETASHSKNSSNTELAGRALQLGFTEAPGPILLHGHCHQKSMGLLPVAKALLARIPGSKRHRPRRRLLWDGRFIRLQP